MFLIVFWIDGWLFILMILVNSLFVFLFSCRFSFSICVLLENEVFSRNCLCGLLMWLIVSLVVFLLLVRFMLLLMDSIVFCLMIGLFSLIWFMVILVMFMLIGSCGNENFCVLVCGVVVLLFFEGRCGRMICLVISLLMFMW